MTTKTTPAEMNRKLLNTDYNGSLCIITLVSGKYQWYAPLFALNLKREYPGYDFRIYGAGDIDYNASRLCVEYSDHPIMECDLSSRNTAAMRFVIEPDCLGEYDYYLITDIDVMMMREDPSLFKQRRMGMDRNKNQIYDNYLVNSDRCPGVHFVHKDWFNATRSSRQEWKKELQRKDYPADFDEQLLLKMITSSNLDRPSEYPALWNQHGVHIGDLRKNRQWRPSATEEGFLARFVSDQQRMQLLMEIRNYCPDVWMDVAKVLQKFYNKE